ncbi:MAG: DegT/DnrJ/EryC1/StrS family aminotransferase [Sedimentisphaerales bacterium]|nr:DegT/DnrJ/EryC1/StrS family aminotransferase [Sedimentisphaerales bacterium]
MTIPVQRPCLGDEELAAVRQVFESRWLGMGAFTQTFEERLKSFLGVRHVVAVNSGTSALHIALRTLDLRAGDEVLVPTLTFVGTTQAVLMAGARPVFCDVEESTFNLDVEDAARRITPRAKVVLPVHYGGTACRMDEIGRLAARENLRVVEDAAHAFGSSYQGRKIGTLSDITCFSFDPIKNITCGEGGAVVTNDPELARRAVSQRMLGISKDAWSRQDASSSWSYDVVGAGYRYHLSNINAAIGTEQLKRFDVFKQRKQEIAQRYDDAFADVEGLTLRRWHPQETCPFFYVVRVLGGHRDDLMVHLKDRGIVTGVHYIPNHLHSAFAEFRVALPVAERLGAEILTLPLFYEMTDHEVAVVISAVREFFGVSRTIVALERRKDASREPDRAPAREGM